MLKRVFILEHRKLLASNALDGRAHFFVFDEFAIFVLEEVLHVDRTGRAVGNLIGVHSNERQIAIALAISISDITENIVIGEIKRVANSVARTTFVTLDLPAEEDLALRSLRHTVGNNGGSVVNNVIGVGIRNLACAGTKLVLDAIGGLFAGNLYELELQRVAVNTIVGVFDDVCAIAIIDDGSYVSLLPATRLPRPISVLPIRYRDVFGTTSRRQINHLVEHLFAVTVVAIHMYTEVLVAILQAKAERGGIARCISGVRSKRLVQTALFEVVTIRGALEVDAFVCGRNDLTPTSAAQVGTRNLEILFGTRNA